MNRKNPLCSIKPYFSEKINCWAAKTGVQEKNNPDFHKANTSRKTKISVCQANPCFALPSRFAFFSKSCYIKTDTV